ncbi:hypothetical protein BS78_04G262700 [Paspalum vaginatum]|nr:hypothetical protein BS78_04G262700 [Paspalum vaginatum]
MGSCTNLQRMFCIVVTLAHHTTLGWCLVVAKHLSQVKSSTTNAE